MSSIARKHSKKRRPWTEIAVVTLVALGAGWGLTRQPLQTRPAAASVAATPAMSASTLPPGSVPPPPPTPSEEQGCGFADRGTGDYESVPVAQGQLLVRRPAVQESGSYRLLLHFHGADAVKKVLAPEAWDLNMLLVDAGDGSGAYRGQFGSTTIVDALVAAADRSVSQHVGRPAKADRIVLTSFSAGYGALAAVLASPEHRERIEGVILLDSLHAPFANGSNDSPDEAALAPFRTAAERARDGAMFMGVTHTAITTHGYASTTQSTGALLAAVGLKEEPVGWAGEEGLRPTSQATRGRLIVRGYPGETPASHCAQIALLPGLLHELMR